MATGLLDKAMDVEKYRQPYQRYVIETQSNGETPLPIKDWVASQQTLNTLQAQTKVAGE